MDIHTCQLPNGETLAYRRAGSGARVLVLLHGNLSSSINWMPLMARTPAEFTIYAVDLRGFGASSYQRKITTLHDFADDVKQFADALGLPPFTLLGWSLGSAIAMAFAARYPEALNNLILVASIPIQGMPHLLAERMAVTVAARDRGDKAFFRALFLRTTYTRHVPDAFEAYLTDILRQQNLAEVLPALRYFNISRHHNGVAAGTGEVDKLSLPVLLLTGDDDTVMPPDIAHANAAAIGGNAQVEILPHCGHSPLTDDPDALARAILVFLQ